MRSVRFAVAVAIVVGTVAASTSLAMAAAADDPAPVPAGRRTLVFTVPGLSWQDVNDLDLPTLRALLDESAVANVSLRVMRRATPAAEGYATVSAGTRAIVDLVDAGAAFGRDEAFGDGTAAEEMARQLGHPTVADVVVPSWERLSDEADSSEFGAELGMLGDALDDGDVGRGVVANADRFDPLVVQPLVFADEGRHREAALALADGDGLVPCGDVTSAVLVDDPSVPFGQRLDDIAVVAAFSRCATPDSVVVVEASDVARAEAYRDRVTSSVAEELRANALESADALLGRLLAQVDRERDAVVVLTPSVENEPSLGVLGIRAAELAPGLLVSGSTRQDGYVTMADVTPTIAALAGVDIDEGALEGRAVEPGETGGSAADRRARLEEADAKARFRDSLITPIAAGYVTAVVVLALVAVGVLAFRQRSRVLEIFALVLLGVTPMTYLSAPFPFYEWGELAYIAFVVGGATAIGLACSRLRRSWLYPAAAAYLVIVLVIVVNVVFLGSGLQLSTVFGDSPIIAGRFKGVNNLGFAQLFIGVVALGITIADRLPIQRARIAIVALFGTTIVVVAAPVWGADVGGTLAGLPALALVGMRLGRWKVRWSTIAFWLVAGVVAVVAFGFYDLTRDSADQTHLGRLFERFGSEGVDGFTTVIERKIAINLRTVKASVWRVVIVPVAIGALLLARRAPERFRSLNRALPGLGAALPGVLVGMVLGYALNDSGVAVPGMMLAVTVPGLVYLVSRAETA
jgi:hypothetical protein